MANISRISAKLVGDADDLENVFKSVTSHIKQLQNASNAVGKNNSLNTAFRNNSVVGQFFSRQLQQVGNDTRRLKSAFVALAAVGAMFGVDRIVEYALQVKHAAIEMHDFADSINLSYDSLSGLHFAATVFGSDVKGLDNGLVTLRKRFQELETGNLATIDLFKRLGFDTKFNLVPSGAQDQLRIVVSNFEKLKTAQEQATFAQQLFGDNAQAMLPILVAGVDKLSQLRAEARQLGITFADVDDLRSLKVASVNVDILKKSYEGLYLQLASQLAPILLSISESVRDMLKNVNIGDLVTSIKSFFMSTYAFIYNLPTNIAIWFVSVRRELVALEKALYELRLSFPGASTLPGFAVDTARVQLLTLAVKSLDDQIGNLEKMKVTGPSVTDKLFGKASLFAAKLADMMKAKEAIQALTATPEELKVGVDIFTANITPLQQFQQEIARLDVLLKRNAISFNTYGRAARTALLTLEQQLNLPDLRLPQAARQNTSEAESMINRAAIEVREKSMPIQERIARAVEAAVTENKNLNMTATDIANTIQAMPRPMVADF